MKRILLAFDGANFSPACLDFARAMNEHDPIVLAGMFLPQIEPSGLWTGGVDMPSVAGLSTAESRNLDEMKHNVSRFESYCRQHHILFQAHGEFFNFAIPELKTAARFADLLIVSSQRFYAEAGTDVSNSYLQEILHELECPLIIIPEKHCAPAATILTYDGSASSVYAIRQFALLFPEWTKHTTTVLHTASKAEAGWPQEQQIRALVSAHFSDVKWELLVLRSKDLLAAWLMENKQAIVVSGSFGRSGLSMIFKKSYIAEAINDHQLPVFIAHK